MTKQEKIDAEIKESTSPLLLQYPSVFMLLYTLLRYKSITVNERKTLAKLARNRLKRIGAAVREIGGAQLIISHWLADELKGIKP